MPSDYKAICRDNIRRRGEEFDDIGRLISQELYSDRSHFVYELLQNAEDALERRFGQNPDVNSPRAVRFRLFPDRLEFRHFGAPFNEEDVKGVSDVLKGTKKDDVAQIGKFGIGFKSVYAFTASPEIHSGDEHFVIKRYIRPEAKAPDPACQIAKGETVFVFPFDHAKLSKADAFELILDKLQELGPRVLLFLRRIDEIEWRVELDGEKGQYLKESDPVNGCKIAHRVTVIGQKDGEEEEDENWLIFERPVSVPNTSGQVSVEVGFRLGTNARDEESIGKIDRSPLVVYFPTEKDTKLGFLIQGPYRTTPARDNIPGNDDWNKKLIRETAELVVESLRQLKEMGLLSVSLLGALPIRFEDNGRFNYSRESALGDFYKEFYPIFSKVREALRTEELLPANDGTFVSARNAKLVRGAELMKILNRERLSALFQSRVEIKWLSSDITQDRTPDLRSYLMQELDIEEVTPETFASKLSDQFLAGQDDKWFIRFYEFLSDQKALTGGILRNKPILRLQDRRHVNPFWNDGSPKAYLVAGSDTETSLPIVKVELSRHEEVRQFLEALGIPELDLVAEVIETILPEYNNTVNVSIEKNKSHLIKIERAYSTDSNEKKSRLVEQLRETPFILAEHPSSGETNYRRPNEVYFGSDELWMYFDKNNSFACVGLDHPQSALFRDLGVEETVRIRRKEKDSQGYIPIVSWHGWHKRGLDGFDPDIHVDGLECAISHSTPGKSAFIWNEIAIPNSDCIHGIIEKSTRQTYERREKEEQLSEFGKLLTETAWLPDSNGNLHKPCDLKLDDLPESFDRDERLADQLGMKKNVVAKLAEEAGIKETTLNIARRIDAAPPEIKQQIDSLLQKENEPPPQQGKIPFAEALSKTFSAPGKLPSNDDTESGGLTPNPSRRREKIQEDIANDIESESDIGERFTFGIRKKWKGKDDQVRVAFVEWYSGQCQICKKTFTQRNGSPYFEGLYLVSQTTAGWIDRVGNVLCLCAEHSAMFQFGRKEVDEDIIQQVMRLKVKAEGGGGHPAIRMKLCGAPVEIEFAEKHLIDLQEMTKASQDQSDTWSEQDQKDLTIASLEYAATLYPEEEDLV